MNDFDDLKNTWSKGKENLPDSSIDIEMLKNDANESKNNTQKAQIVTIAILSITLLVLIYFFTQVAPFQQLLSRVGVTLMCGGLLIRIIIEVNSLRKSSNLNITQNPAELVRRLVVYYHYRAKIHGMFTYVIVLLYIVGFYMLTPEFSLYLDSFWFWMMHISFIFIAIILFWLIRKGVVEELSILRKFTAVNDKLVE